MNFEATILLPLITARTCYKKKERKKNTTIFLQ